MYAPYVVTHHPNIPSLGYLNRPPSIIPSYMLLKILPPEELPNSLWGIIQKIIIMSNKSLNLLKKIRRYYRIRRDKVDDLESQSSHDYLRQSEGGGVIAPKYQDLADVSENEVSVD